jgi:GT2 family glycosyltransferase
VLSIIIPTYRRNSVLQITLTHLEDALKNILCEVIIINDSKDSAVVIESRIKNLRIVQNPKSGAASARNYGFEVSNGSILLFLDDDIVVSENVISKLMTIVKLNNKEISLPNWVYPNSLMSSLDKNSFGRFLKKINYTSLRGWVKTSDSWESEKVENSGIASFCLMLSRDSFSRIGGYNESFSFAGFEDHDLSYRLSNAGYKFFILTKYIVYHNEQDRVDLSSWLRRRRRNALTQREAVEVGYENLKIHNKFDFFPFPRLLIIISSSLEFFCTIMPNVRILDFAYFRAVDILVAINIYLGYNYDHHKQEN